MNANLARMFLSIVAAFSLATFVAAADSPARPNVVLIFADDK